MVLIADWVIANGPTVTAVASAVEPWTRVHVDNVGVGGVMTALGASVRGAAR